MIASYKEQQTIRNMSLPEPLWLIKGKKRKFKKGEKTAGKCSQVYDRQRGDIR